MKPTLYHKLLRLIEQNQLTSITIDIFDTILLFDYWPDSLRRYELSKIWAPKLQQYVSPDITDYEISDWYRSAKQLLEDSEQPIRLDLCIETMVSLLCHKYNLQLDSKLQLDLLIALITDELKFIVDNTKVNRHLVAQLSAIKQLSPKIKLYCLSNTHLTCDQVKTILQIAKIDNIFDSGVCTADFDTPNPSFSELTTQLNKNFILGTNFHISASHAAYSAALAAGSLAYHYRPVRMRGLRTLAGQIVDSYNQSSAQIRANSRYNPAINPHTEADSIVSQISKLWSCQLYTQLELCAGSAFLLPTTEITIDGHANLTQASGLDQDTILRAFIWLLANHASARWDAASLLRILVKTVKIPNRLALYQLCYEDSYITSEFIINSRTEATFYEDFLNEIRSNSSDNIERLRQSYANVAQYLPRDDKKLYYINLYHDDSAWLFREFARLHGLPNTIIDWRPLQLPQNLAAALHHTPDYELPHIELAPDRYLRCVLQPRLRQLAKKVR